MAVGRQVDLLEPVDLAEHLDKVELYLGQVCQVAGISKMQLDYWTNKAQIPTKGKKQRIYDMGALETVMLIKQAKDKGLNLGAELDAGEDGQARKQLEVPVAVAGERVQPRVPRHRPLDCAKAADRLGDELERRRELLARERVRLCLERGDEQLVGRASGGMRHGRDASALDHAELVVAEHVHDGAPLLRDGRRRLPQPDELGVRMGQARAGVAALVDDRMDVREAAGPSRLG